MFMVNCGKWGLLADKSKCGYSAAWNADVIKHNIKRFAGPKGSRTPRIWPSQSDRKTRDGQPDCYCTAPDFTGNGDGDNEGGYSGPTDPDGFDNGQLKETLREFIGTLIELLDPRYAEVVRRAEILDQPPSEIADEMNLSEREVATRLQAGRRALLHLVMLTVQPDLQE
tara:strand:+ start:364 stop:870 length:507 start_codon:yes stop_codon:yes gene_type:complete